MRYLLGFFGFWYGFVVGDDWTVAAGVVGSLGVAAALAHRHLLAWLWLPAAVAAVLTASLWRASKTLGRKRRGPSSGRRRQPTNRSGPILDSRGAGGGMEKIRVKMASPGLDAGGVLAALLGDEFLVEEFSPGTPLRDQVGAAHVLLVRSVPVTREVIDAAPHLRLIQRPGVNVEAVDGAYAAEKGIPVCNIPRELLREPYVAEHAMFLILALAKRFPETQESLRARRSGQPLTLGLQGKTLGLIGVGRTGTPLARMARAFEMEVWAVKRTVSEESRSELGLTWLQPYGRLPELLRQSDFVSIHLPLLRETTGFVGKREIGLMKPTAFLINTSRGPIVDKDALVAALHGGRLAGAGLDVFWEEPPDPGDPLLQLPTVIATPHVAGFTREGVETLARHSAENIRRVMTGLPARYVLNGAQR